MAQRPVSVTIFGILNIGLAIFGVAYLVLTKIIMTLVKLPSNPITDSLHNNPTYIAWSNVSMIMGVLAYSVMLVAGVGLLLLKKWGRILSIGYSVFAIVWAVISAGVTFSLASNSLHQAFARFGQLGIVIAVVSAVVGLVLTMTYPVLLLIFMLRPNVVAAFREATTGGPPVVAAPPPSL